MKRTSGQFIPLIIIALATAIFIGFYLHSNKNKTPMTLTYEIINTFPHDPEAFTQGLVFDNGFLYEGTGLHGRSSLRKIQIETGKVLQICELDEEYFGEGITIFGDKIIQLTYKAGIGFVYDKETFKPLEQFSYPTEGWGITHNNVHLIRSDGTPNLHFLDPESYEPVRTIEVTDQNVPAWGLNELEYIDGKIYANLWPSETIVIIEPAMGKVIGKIDMKGLLPHGDYNPQTDVLNGIAYDPAGKRLFVTGKNWPKLYEIKIVPQK